MNIKAAIFDMDGTLIDSLMCWDILWAKYGELYRGDGSFRPSVEVDKKIRTVILSEAMDLIHATYGFGSSGEELLQLTNDFLEDFYANTVQLKKGVGEFLEYCRLEGIKMCIASAATAEMVEAVLKYHGIESYFSDIISCADVGKSKEEPDVFIKACEVLGEKAEETWVFEDSLAAIKSARKAGLNTVGIYDAYNFGQEEIKAIATEYIADGESLLKLI